MNNLGDSWYWEDGTRYLPAKPDVFDRWADNHPAADWVGLCVVSRQVNSELKTDEKQKIQDDFNKTYYPWESESCNAVKENDIDAYEYRAICVDKLDGPKVTCNSTGLMFDWIDKDKTNGTYETNGLPKVRR